MTTVPDELKQDAYWANITLLAQVNNVDIAVYEAEITRTYNEPFLKGIAEGLPRWKNAASILYARHNRNTIVKVEPYLVRVLSTEPARTFTNKQSKKKSRASTALAFVQATGKPGAKPGLARISFYDSGVKGEVSNADRIQNVKEGAFYNVLLAGSFKDGTYNLTADARSKFDSEAQVTEGPLVGSVEELIQKNYPRVTAADLHKYVNKVVQFVGDVVISMTRPTKKTGGSFGKYTLIDDTLSPDAIGKGGGVGVMCNPEQVKYGPGSRIIIIGKVTKHPQYGLGMNATMVIPIVNVPMDEVEDEESGGSSGAAVADFSEFEEPEEQ